MKWISVKDSLPPINTTVLAIDDFDIYLCKIVEYADGHKAWTEKIEAETLTGITHWLPIPELPR